MRGPACQALVDDQGRKLKDIHHMEWNIDKGNWFCDACEVVKAYARIKYRKRQKRKAER